MARKQASEIPLELNPIGPNQRILLAVAVGVLVTWPLWSALPFPYPMAIGWIVGVIFFLGVTAVILSKATPDRMRARARKQDPLRPLLFSVVIAAAAVSFVALGFMLGQKGASGMGAGARILVAGLAVLCSWTLTHTMFALHYAHLYYGDDPLVEGEQDRGGLKFPDERVPDFWDFLYFSFVVGMTCQVSDVQVTSRHMRRLTLGHGVLAFFFNAVILALAVNFIAGAV
ncbi:MAG: DUF1345 domain-containing protein [Alphaproteobacteria bacterium]|nr:DUF1345 domain-containing protein [Alphaproteobacteria bacterium]MDE1931393.1 DUF1345 domain-containing protein [Alphaproteobacteria bacterium]